jgi:hypothetical protein
MMMGNIYQPVWDIHGLIEQRPHPPFRGDIMHDMDAGEPSAREGQTATRAQVPPPLPSLLPPVFSVRARPRGEENKPTAARVGSPRIPRCGGFDRSTSQRQRQRVGRRRSPVGAIDGDCGDGDGQDRFDGDATGATPRHSVTPNIPQLAGHSHLISNWYMSRGFPDAAGPHICLYLLSLMTFTAPTMAAAPIILGQIPYIGKPHRRPPPTMR